MRSSLNPFMYKPRSILDLVEVTPGTYRKVLQPGIYTFKLCGAGGAGGSSTSVAGGGGANGLVTSQQMGLPYGADIEITVGRGGIANGSGGNGGAGGAGHASADYAGGFGGGGGWPSIIKINTRKTAYYWGMGIYTLDTIWKPELGNTQIYNADGTSNTNWTRTTTFGVFQRTDGVQYTSEGPESDSIATAFTLYADGGGGGGGAGGRGYTRYDWAGGGGGGGYYYYDASSALVRSTPGQAGAAAANAWEAGKAGLSGWGDISITAGHGGHSGYENKPNGYAGGYGGFGYGASGGSGAASLSNHSTGIGGAGGGGAPGGPRAHGGFAQSDSWAGGTNGSNADATGVPSVDPWGNSASTSYGAGGNAGQNGGSGWIRIIQKDTSNTSVINLGLVTEPVTDTLDLGLVTESTTNILNLGKVE